MKRAIGYIRVSTEQQANEGVSLDAQREKIAAYANLYDFTLVEVLVDAGQSASTLERTGLQAALSALEDGRADALIVVKLDRLTRSVRDLDTLLSQYFAERFALVSVAEQVDTTTATGRMILNVLMSVSQWEREVISERTKAAMQHKKMQGEYTGGQVPFGYTVVDGKLVEQAAEQSILRDMRTLQSNGLSLSAIATELDARGAQRRNGNKWNKKSVHIALKWAA